MKRILSLVLILILALSAITACGGNETTTNAVDYKLDDVAEYVKGVYTNLVENPVTAADFTLITSLKRDGNTYTIEWKTNNSAVAVNPVQGSAEVKVVIPASETAFDYKLTGTITAPDASSKDIVFDLTVPASSGSLTPVSNPQVGVAYIFGMYSTAKQANFFLKGGMSGYYLATTTADDAASAMHYYLENAEGGYYIYCLESGVKTYINFVIATGSDGKEHTNAVYSTTPSTVFTFNSKGIFSTTLNDVEYGFGTYDNYVTMGPNKTSYENNYFGYFFTPVASSPESGNNGGNGGNSGNDGGNTGSAPSVPAGVASLEVGKGYKVVAANSSSLLWVTTGITSGRFNGSASEADALVMYVESVDGGYLLYATIDGTKTYICMDDKSAGGKTTTNAAEATVYEWNEDLKTLQVADDDNGRAFGTQNTSSYTTFSAYATSNASDPIYVWGQFIAAN